MRGENQKSQKECSSILTHSNLFKYVTATINRMNATETIKWSNNSLGAESVQKSSTNVCSAGNSTKIHLIIWSDQWRTSRLFVMFPWMFNEKDSGGCETSDEAGPNELYLRALFVQTTYKERERRSGSLPHEYITNKMNMLFFAHAQGFRSYWIAIVCTLCLFCPFDTLLSTCFWFILKFQQIYHICFIVSGSNKREYVFHSTSFGHFIFLQAKLFLLLYTWKSVDQKIFLYYSFIK